MSVNGHSRNFWIDAGKAREAVIRLPLKDIGAQLDASQLVQVHRSVVVNLSAIAYVTLGANETAELHLKERDEVLPEAATTCTCSGKCRIHPKVTR